MRILHLLFLCLFSGQTFAQDTDTTVYKYVDEEAEFPGGYAAMMQWVWKNVAYDSSVSLEELNKKVMVSFIVEKNGTISQAEALNNNYLSKEIARCATQMPVWTPAHTNGKICRSVFTLPIYVHFE